MMLIYVMTSQIWRIKIIEISHEKLSKIKKINTHEKVNFLLHNLLKNISHVYTFLFLKNSFYYLKSFTFLLWFSWFLINNLIFTKFKNKKVYFFYLKMHETNQTTGFKEVTIDKSPKVVKSIDIYLAKKMKSNMNKTMVSVVGILPAPKETKMLAILIVDGGQSSESGRNPMQKQLWSRWASWPCLPG